MTGLLAAASGARTAAIAGAVFVVLLFVLGTARFALRRPRRPGEPDIPPTMRPGPTDAELEGPRLERLQAWGLVLVLFLALWVPAVWLHEPSTNVQDQLELQNQSILRGAADVQLNSASNPEGIGCVRCHGNQLQGWYNVYNGVVVSTPDLQTVCGGGKFGHPQINGAADVINVIEQGRPNTDMPSWSVRYSGSLDDQQINDIVNYIISMNQQHVPKKDNVCLSNPTG